MRIFSYFLAILGLIGISACGGGGGGGGTTPPPVENKAPTVTVSPVTVNEGDSVSLVANAADSDGTISSYSWQQLNGSSVTLSDTTSANLNFDAPEIDSNSALTFRVTVTDNDGATASADVTVQVKNLLHLQISGKVNGVTSDSLQVSTSLGGEVFSTNVDASGDYNLTIDVVEDEQDQMVVLSATDTTNTSLILRNYTDTLAQLIGIAGPDGLLQATEFAGVNLSYYSSAVSALIERQNGNVMPQDGAEVARLIKTTPFYNAMASANAVKLVTERSGTLSGLSLPTGVSDTYQLISQQSSLRDYLANASLNFRSEYGESLQTLIDEPANQGAFSSSLASFDFNFIQRDTSSDYGHWTLKADGTAELVMNNSGGRLIGNWQNSNGSLTLEFGPSGEFYSSKIDWVAINGITQQVNIEFYLRSAKVDAVYSFDNLMVVRLQLDWIKHFPDVELADDFYSQTELVATTLSTGIVEADTVFSAGKTFILPARLGEADVSFPAPQYSGIWGQVYDIYTAVITLNENDATLKTKVIARDGSMSFSERSLGWRLADTKTLEIADGAQRYQVLDIESDHLFVREESTTVENSEMLVRSYGRVAGEQGTNDWDQDSIPGIYVYRDIDESPLDQFWFELNADGSALTVSSQDDDQDGVLADYEFLIYPGYWQLTADGRLVIRRYRSNPATTGNGSACNPPAFEVAPSDDCVLYHQRYWDLAARWTQGGREHLAIENVHQFFEDAFYTSDNPYDPTNTEHLLGYVSSLLISLEKVSARPVEIPPSLLKGKLLKARNGTSPVEDLELEQRFSGH